MVKNRFVAALLAFAIVGGVWLIAPRQAQSASRSRGSASMTVAQAIKRSQQTGQPIFAVAGASFCPACKQLLNTLNTDESLQPLIEQFVALKIDAQSQDYARWKQFFPLKRAAIPALYIVTPQGKQLYGEVGALPSQNLRSVMLTSLEKAGRYPSKEQWHEIGQMLKSVEIALNENRVDQAIQLLQPTLASLAKIDSLVELSPAGKDISKSLEQFASQQEASLKKALQTFSQKSDLDAALQVAAAARFCELFPQLKSQVKKDVRKIAANSEKRKLLRQARELQQAEALAAQEKTQRKAQQAFKQIVKRYPESAAAVRAQRKLQEISEAVSASSAGKK